MALPPRSALRLARAALDHWVPPRFWKSGYSLSWSIQPFGHNRHGPKIGGGCAPFFWGAAGSPSNTYNIEVAFQKIFYKLHCKQCIQNAFSVTFCSISLYFQASHQNIWPTFSVSLCVAHLYPTVPRTFWKWGDLYPTSYGGAAHGHGARPYIVRSTHHYPPQQCPRCCLTVEFCL